MYNQQKPAFLKRSNRPSSAAKNLSAVLPPATSTALVAPNHYAIDNSYAGVALSVNDDDDSDGGLIESWRLLRRHKRTIIFSSLAGLVIGFAVCIPTKPIFRASTTIEVLTINGDFMNQKQSNPTTTSDTNYDTSEAQTQAQLLQSGTLLKRVIARLRPAATQDAAASTTQRRTLAKTGWRSWLHLAEPVVESARQSQLGRIASTLKVRPSPRTRVLEISIESTDPQLAAVFANTLTQEFMAQNIEAHWASSRNTGEWLRLELEDARSKLQDSENALQTYATTSGLVFTDENTNVVTQKLQQLQQNLSASTADRIAKQARYELAQNAPPDSIGDVLNDVSLRDTQAKIDDLKRQLAETSTIFAPESNKIQRLQAEITALQFAFDRQEAGILAHIQNDYTEANRKEKLLAAAYSAQTQEVTGQDQKAIQYNILKRDVDSNRQLYDTMLQQMKQASIASAIRAGNVRVVDPADVPLSPISPSFKMNSAIGMLAGLFFSVGFVIVRERADRTLQKPGDIKLWTNLIELGVIPNASGSSQHYGSLAKGEPKRAKDILGVSEPLELAIPSKRPSISAEAFRSALTSMLFINDEEHRPQVILFTSANAADGKTTIVSNLAIAAAEINMRVLVIDADLRRPRLHELFKGSNERGVVDILTGDVSEDDLSFLIQSTEIANIFLLPAGPSSQAAAHLLYSPMWKVLLEKVRAEYDMIFVDTPPMLQMTDARVAARMADAVVLVARSNRTTRDVMIAVKQRLTEERIPILGALLNDWDPQHSAGGYYGYYRDHYYRANHYDAEKTSWS